MHPTHSYATHLEAAAEASGRMMSRACLVLGLFAATVAWVDHGASVSSRQGCVSAGMAWAHARALGAGLSHAGGAGVDCVDASGPAHLPPTSGRAPS